MARKAAQRLSRALVTAVESARNGHMQRYRIVERSSALRPRAFAQMPCFSGERFQEHRGSVLRYGSRHHFCSSSKSEKIQESDDDSSDDALSKTVLKLQHDALEISGNGHPEKASQMLDEAAKLLAEEPNVGLASQAGVGIFMTHTTVLLRAGMFEKLSEICKAMIGQLKELPGAEMVTGMAWLRLGCAELGGGDLRAAADAMRECTVTLQPLADTAEAEAAFLFPELKFYCVLLNLYLAKSPEDVRGLEGSLLESVSGMLEAAPPGAGAEWPFVVAALQAHSKLLHTAIDGDAEPGIIHALFQQITLLHRAAGCGPEDLALVQYQHGTWTYAETDDLQHARDLVQESLEELEAVNPARDGNAEAEGDEDLNSLPDEEKLARSHFNHQAALRRFRIAVIDSVMVALSLRAATPELSRETQGTLSVIAATYDDLLGDENAISAECRFGLSLWGVQEGLRAADDTRAAVEANMRRCLHVLARSMPAGKDHMLVQRLLRVYEGVVGPYELVEEEDGHAHGHTHEHGPGCGHEHAHDGTHTHTHEHTHEHGPGCAHNNAHDGTHTHEHTHEQEAAAEDAGDAGGRTGSGGK